MAGKRSIFEEVSEPTRQEIEPGVIDRGRDTARSAIRIWIMVLFRLLNINLGASFVEYFMMFLSAATQFLARFRDPGVIQFQNNTVRTEVFTRTDAALSLVTVLSPCDVQISDNALNSAHGHTAAFVHLLGVGVNSTQCVANRIQTRIDTGVLGSALTIGRENTTYLNHASHPIAQMRTAPAVPAGPGNVAP